MRLSAGSPSPYPVSASASFSTSSGNISQITSATMATMNVYTQPTFDRYIERLERGLAELGFSGRLPEFEIVQKRRKIEMYECLTCGFQRFESLGVCEVYGG